MDAIVIVLVVLLVAVLGGLGVYVVMNRKKSAVPVVEPRDDSDVTAPDQTRDGPGEYGVDWTCERDKPYSSTNLCGYSANRGGSVDSGLPTAPNVGDTSEHTGAHEVTRDEVIELFRVYYADKQDTCAKSEMYNTYCYGADEWLPIAFLLREPGDGRVAITVRRSMSPPNHCVNQAGKNICHNTSEKEHILGYAMMLPTGDTVPMYAAFNASRNNTCPIITRNKLTDPHGQDCHGAERTELIGHVYPIDYFD
jgi:hypothetical protein